MRVVIKPFLVVFSTIVLLAACAKQTPTSLKAKIIKITGNTAMVQRGQSLLPLMTGDMVSARDIIKTGKDSSLSLLLSDIGICYIRANSILSISNLLVQDGGRQTTLRLTEGHVSTFVNKLSKDESFEILTPVAVVGVRGTAFDVNATEKGDVEVAVLEGTVDVKNESSGKTVLVPSSNQTVVKPQISKTSAATQEMKVEPINKETAENLSRLQRNYKSEDPASQVYKEKISFADDFKNNAWNPRIWYGAWTNNKAAVQDFINGQIHFKGRNDKANSWVGAGLTSLPIDQILNADVLKRNWTYSVDVTLYPSENGSSSVQITEDPKNPEEENFNIDIDQKQIIADVRRHGKMVQHPISMITSSLPLTFHVSIMVDPINGIIAGLVNGKPVWSENMQFSGNASIGFNSGVWSVGSFEGSFNNVKFETTDKTVEKITRGLSLTNTLTSQDTAEFFWYFYGPEGFKKTVSDGTVFLTCNSSIKGIRGLGMNTKQLSTYVSSEALETGLWVATADVKTKSAANMPSISMSFDSGQWDGTDYMSVGLGSKHDAYSIDVSEQKKFTMGNLAPANGETLDQFRTYKITYNPRTMEFRGYLDGKSIGSTKIKLDPKTVNIKLLSYASDPSVPYSDMWVRNFWFYIEPQK